MKNKENLTDYDIEIFNLGKNYKIKGKKREITALKNINLNVKRGEIFGLLGPNGAGKTTMVSILTTLIQPTDGYAIVLNRNILTNPRYIKRNIGLMLGADMIYYRMTGYKNLKFFCKIYGIKDYKQKINNLAERFGLINWLNQLVENYSSGMKVKIALARVLLTDPKILFLDEPMLGLDPTFVNELINILLKLNKTIFLTSHQMNVVQKLCDRIAFLKNGEIITVDTRENFMKLLKEKEVRLSVKISSKQDKFINQLKNLDFISDIKTENEKILITIPNESYYPKLFENLKNFPIIQINEQNPTLEDVFIELSK